jgi:DNA recombination protein RmuC
MDTMVVPLLIFLVLLIFIGIILQIILISRKSDSVSPPQTFIQAIGPLQSELRSVSERLSTVERDQSNLIQNLSQFGAKLAETGSTTQGVFETTTSIRNTLASTQESLAALHSHLQARQQLEQQTSEAVKRLETIIAGTQTKGVAGENIIDLVFSRLPPEWQARNVRIGNKMVEFGLRLPNHLILPIDSKWPATNLLEQFLNTDDVEEQKQLKKQIEKAVLNKAEEVRKYLDPNLTVNFGIAAVPDAVFDLCSYIQVEALQFNVVVISYSMFIPYLLLAFQTILRTSENIDVQKLMAYLETAQTGIKDVQNEVEGRLSKAINMLVNSRDEMRIKLGKVNSGISAIQLSAPENKQIPELSGSRVIDAS